MAPAKSRRTVPRASISGPQADFPKAALSESPQSTAAEADADEAADLRQIMERPANQSLPQLAVDTTFTA